MYSIGGSGHLAIEILNLAKLELKKALFFQHDTERKF